MFNCYKNLHTEGIYGKRYKKKQGHRLCFFPHNLMILYKPGKIFTAFMARL